MASTSTRVSGDLVMLMKSEGWIWWLLVVALLQTHPLVTRASAVPHRQRLFKPCSGSRSVILDAVDVEEISDPSVKLDTAFQHLAHKTERLRRRVRDLKGLYVAKRFKDNRVVTELDDAGLKVDGMPSTHSATVSSIGHSQVVSTVHKAFDDLARVAVFIDQARLGEILATDEHVTFEEEFQIIEDHHEEGLYFILCAVHQVIKTLAKPINEETYNEIMNLKVTEVDRNALRHTRDYLVLRDFEKILARLSIDFASLKELHSSQT